MTPKPKKRAGEEIYEFMRREGVHLCFLERRLKIWDDGDFTVFDNYTIGNIYTGRSLPLALKALKTGKA